MLLLPIVAVLFTAVLPLNAGYYRGPVIKPISPILTGIGHPYPVPYRRHIHAVPYPVRHPFYPVHHGVYPVHHGHLPVLRPSRVVIPYHGIRYFGSGSGSLKKYRKKLLKKGHYLPLLHYRKKRSWRGRRSGSYGSSGSHS